MPRKVFPPSVRGGKRVTLRKKQLRQLAEAGKLALSTQQEKDLQDTCTTYLVHSKFEQEGVLASAVTGVYEGLISDLSAVITSIAHVVGQETAQHHDVHVELEEKLEAVSSEETVCTVLHRIMAFQSAAVEAREEHVSRFGGPGRPIENESLRAFIWDLANLFEAAGGKAGVTYRSIDNSLQSSFLTWLKTLNGFLPKQIQIKATALPDLVREVCRARNKKKKPRRQKKQSSRKRSAK